NTAKELSMIENNEKGRQARKYFIECEHNLKQIQLSIKEMETKDWGYSDMRLNLEEAISIEVEIERLIEKQGKLLKNIELTAFMKRENPFEFFKIYKNIEMKEKYQR
ncbi:MAG: hypothetical protein ACRC6K_00130, partial [Fusobacteriaceae bacterium]